ncbi:C4-dicarboxylate ABC transporter substrate-binding protein [Limnochorda pilosa]|uniref:C4-dicarboxylate ABC transporter substrate-binding protein n=1 Tax=Limnochorda pilosa TaxID=1555112 RepID=A0A0K2SLN5_LIMPI|nr:C4-dicarboxylate ABC transporter substrate-binding protein [Limnochorda pilosa]
MTRFISVTLLAAMLVVTASGLAQAKTITIRLPHCCAVDSHFDVGATKFAEILEEKTDGQLQVRVFPGGQLGQETEVIQGVQNGIIEMTFIGHDPLAQFAPITTLLSLPYLFRDHEHAFRVLDGPVGDAIEQQLASKNLLVLGWGNNGARVYTNSQRPIERPEDLRGLKIRSPENPVNLAITKAMGGTAVAIPYGEVYTALQQGTIDGQENAVINIYPARLQEVQKYMSMTNHLLSFTVLVVNKRFFDSLSPDLQAAVRSAAAEALEYQRRYVEEVTSDLIQKMEAEGVQVNWPDLEPFRKATRSVHDGYIGKKFSRELYETLLQTP